ncbi:MAG TPA: alpha/beta fold hydrolase [Candidatus Microbacterium stercoravium]|uniref:Alpha/beta fold hydrolase n=1 Tax=Candidatus Microbacterium stercoravium TaxID=2838697 RepID=A0A9D2H590_9MICO|nr:alpha/beta fold hydrolase [Candidatus Microbacterium stercoravium]
MSAVTTPTGDRVVFDRYGPERAPGVLFISGAGPTRAEDPETTAAARLLGERGVQASVHDRVGRGDSAADGPIDLERELRAIEALAGELGGPVVLTGHSSGCAIAMLAAARIAACAGVVLWEAPIGQFDDGAPAWWDAVAAHIDADRLEDAVAAYMVGMPPEWIEELKRSPQYPSVVLSWMPDGMALSLVEHIGLEEALRGVAEPVLALVGAETFPGMAETASAIARAAPNGAAEELAGAWHSWEPAAMASRLDRFVRDAVSSE